MNKEKYNQIIKEAYEKYHQENKKVMYLTFLLEEEFIRKIKTDNEFSENWGLKIEERELSTQERKKLCDVDLETECRNNAEIELYLELQNIPTKLITLTYQNETIECYE
jgi:hypothetical protein